MGKEVKGTVTHEMEGSRFAVETIMGFSLLEWYGGTSFVSEGQVVVGEIHSHGMKEIRMGTKTMKVWVEDFGATEEEADSYVKRG